MYLYTVWTDRCRDTLSRILFWKLHFVISDWFLFGSVPRRGTGWKLFLIPDPGLPTPYPLSLLRTLPPLPDEGWVTLVLVLMGGSGPGSDG